MIPEDTYFSLLIILAFFRFVGGILFLDFYFRYKEKRFLVITSAFTLFSLNPFIQLFIPTYNTILNGIFVEQELFEIVYIVSEILTSIAILFFVLVTFTYVIDINPKIAFLVLVGVVLTPLSFLFLDFFELAFYAKSVINISILASLIPFVLKQWGFFQRFTQGTPIFIFIAVIVAVSNIVSSFFTSDIFLWLEMITRIIISFIVPFVLVKLESFFNVF